MEIFDIMSTAAVPVLSLSEQAMSSSSLYRQGQQTSQEASGSNAGGDVLTPQFTPQQIEEFNKQLEGKSPQEILTLTLLGSTFLSREGYV
jgi:hypothetical protein